MVLHHHPSNNNYHNHNINHCIKANTTTIFKNGLRRLVPFLAACYVALAVLSVCQTARFSQQLASLGVVVPNDRDGLTHHHHDSPHHLIQHRRSFPAVPSPWNQTRTTTTTTAQRTNTSAWKPAATRQIQKRQTTRRTKTKTLALLYPPGMIGGYRNQVLRFISFCRYAQQHNISQLLLPSILWSTQYKAQFFVVDDNLPPHNYNEFFPIPMEWVFDVIHWNTFSNHLPRLVPSMEDDDDNDENDIDKQRDQDEAESCWKPVDQTKLQEDYYYRLVSTPTTKSTTAMTKISNSTSTSFVSPLAKILLETIPFLTPLINITRAVLTGQLRLNPRKIDFLPNVQHCQHPYVYGGGTGAGRLWNDYLAAPKELPGVVVVEETNTYDNKNNNENRKQAKEMTDLMAWISRALQPAPKWQIVANTCVETLLLQQDNNQFDIPQDATNHQQHAYIALHARVEMDMMIHKCGRQMEKNLTKLFDMVEDYRLDYNNKHNNNPQSFSSSSSLDGVFVAVSRSGMQQPFPSSYKDIQLQQLALENIQTLRLRSSSTRFLLLDDTTTTKEEEDDEASFSSQWQRKSSLFFECGELWMQRWYQQQQLDRKEDKEEEESVPDDYYGSLIPSMMNFYIATQATVFIGVAKSSWSTDVWTTRYYQGKGDTNLEYTSTGIRPLPHGGLPPPHKNC
jgi:hypothetical protein